MDDTLAAVLLIILGWLFGLLAPIVTNHSRQARENKEVSRSLSVELSELKYRLAVVTYRIHMHNGTVDRELLKWLLPIVANYTGVNPQEHILQFIKTQLDMSDDQIAALSEHSRAEEGVSLSLKKYNASLLESRFALISSFDASIQNDLIELRTSMNMLNEEADQARYFYNLSFDSGLSSENHATICQNLENNYIQYANMAKKIVNHIDCMSWK